MTDRFTADSVVLPKTDSGVLPKAHFSDRTLTDVILDDDITEIGVWAYAKCVNLKEITIPIGCVVSDRAFEGCSSLEMIHISGIEYLAHLLALAVRNRPLDTFRMTEAAMRSGSTDGAEFFEVFDELLSRYLAEPDNSGYVPFLAGGEEDYADDRLLEEAFIRERRKEKARLAYERLRVGDESANNSVDSGIDIEKVCLEYLRDNNPEISFALLAEPGAYMQDYRKSYFENGLNKEADTEELLEMSGRDTGLRARVLAYSGADGQDDMAL